MIERAIERRLHAGGSIDKTVSARLFTLKCTGVSSFIGIYLILLGLLSRSGLRALVIFSDSPRRHSCTFA
jgi:hypothetical protein